MRKDIIVIYNSQTGFTKKYAQWISESLECECVELNVADKLNFEQYDAIIFGGWACAGGISKIKWFKNNLKKWNDKKLAVYCVGGSPIENPEIEMAMKNWFTKEEHQKVKTFYCPGGFNYERMSGTSKLMMKMFKIGTTGLNTRHSTPMASMRLIKPGSIKPILPTSS